jgi:probable phosphoglycerate mutase
MTKQHPETTADAPLGRRRIYLMRHGSVSYFEPGKVPRHPDEVDLNEEGRAQAAAAGEALRSIPFDRVVTSDLARCVQTAELVLGERPMQVQTHRALREIAPGNIAQIPPESIAELMARAFHPVDRETPFLAGETFGSLIDRVTEALAKLLAEPDWRHLLLVAHGGVNRVLLMTALGAPVNRFGSVEQDEACINLIDAEPDGRLLVRMVNFTPYNVDKRGLEATTMERLYAQYQRMLAASQ